MIYLAEKSEKFMPQSTASRIAVLEWLMFQMGSVGPMLGQAHHFRKYSKITVPYAVDRYTKEATRIYNVLDKRLGITPFLAGDYSIADMAVNPWLRPYRWQGQELSEFSNLQRWYSAVRERPAVQRGLKVMEERLKPKTRVSLREMHGIFCSAHLTLMIKNKPKPPVNKGPRS